MNQTAFVCDISSYGTLRIAGEDALQFVRTMCTGPIDEELALLAPTQGLLLTSEGEIIDVVTVLRTGDAEFLMLTFPQNTDEVFEWLQAHAEIADDNGPVFANLTVEDHSELMAVLLLFGQGVEKAYKELIAACEGQVAVVACDVADGRFYGVPEKPAHILFAPINAASAIGDFLLDYMNIEVITEEELIEKCIEKGTYLPQLYEAEYVKADDVSLWDFIRDGNDFVGARSLKLR